MPDPTGRWITESSWQCPVCATINSFDRERCVNCGKSVRPSNNEPIRPVDPLDVVGRHDWGADDGDDAQRASSDVPEDIAPLPDGTD
jgi:hypothetical protein